MYKTSESVKLPEYMDCSVRDKDYMGDTQPHQSPSKSPQYRLFAMNYGQDYGQNNQNLQKTRSRSETSFSDNISLTTTRSTATQDLADFLKTSSPDDFKRYLSSSSEDLSTGAGSRGGSFRFLRSPIHGTSPTRVNTAPPTTATSSKNVVSKTTSKGKPYLQIHVDYGETHFGSHATSVSQQTNFSSETSSDYNRNSTTTSLSTGAYSMPSPRGSCSGERSISPTPPRNAQESKVSLDVATMGRYQQFLDSETDIKTGTISDSARSVPRSYTSDIVAMGMAEMREFQKRERLRSPPRSPSGAYPSSVMGSTKSSPRRRSRSEAAGIVRPRSQVISARSSMNSVVFEDVTDIEFEVTTGSGAHIQRKKSRKTPPMPGPPPNRSLPSLPENHSALRPDEAEERRPTPTRTRISRMSITSTTTTCQFDDAESIRSDRKTREERVKARKAKDMQRMRERSKIRQNSEPSETYDSNRRRSTTGQSTFSDSTGRRSSLALTEHPASSFNSLPNSPSENKPAHPRYAKGFDSGASENASTPSTPTVTVSTHNVSAREMEMEARILAVERKNKMLEQALMAVIRSTVNGQTQRKTELFKANDMEELLDELNLEELPTVFTGGQLV
ncbi:hypothetical protein DFP73DRAFT_590497 [Morchella snyderi]|nr:hypothetical protein DFP73DRAFT_590497 [Morchella snyderi]